MQNEMRFRIVEKQNPKRFKRLLQAAEHDARRRVEIYEKLAALATPPVDAPRFSTSRSEPRAAAAPLLPAESE